MLDWNKSILNMMNGKNSDVGIVYVLSNPAMPKMVKIGQTKRDKIDARLKELYSTGVPLPFVCEYACRVSVSDCEKIERALHAAFAPQRVNKNREFFEVEIEQVVAILKLFNREDVTQEVTEELNNELTVDDREAVVQFKSRRPRLNYYELGMKPGDKLVFIDDRTKEVTITDERRVSYEGEQYSLTAITIKLLNLPYNISPAGHWEFNGKKLQDIYDERYPWLD